MKVLIVSSCTGVKTTSCKEQLTLKDFKKGTTHVRVRETELRRHTRSAREMYSGQQHKRLLAGIDKAVKSTPGLEVQLDIVSAGYGLISADKTIAPYEATFSTMNAQEIQEWGDTLRIHDQLSTVLEVERDLNILLLGDPYLRAAKFDKIVAYESFESPTVVFCSTAWAKKLGGTHQNLHVVPLYNPDAKRFRCGLTALKGELAGRLLCMLGKTSVRPLVSGPAIALLDRLYLFNLVEQESTS